MMGQFFFLLSICTRITFSNAIKIIPWNGQIQNFNADTINTKYMLHILTQRLNNPKDDPSKWFTIHKNARTLYNGDKDSIDIKVDNQAIFNNQKNFRRSEIVQVLDSSTASNGAFYRASLFKESNFNNKYEWQVFFSESHTFEVRIDARKNPPKLLIIKNGDITNPIWIKDMSFKVWYNFGFHLYSGEMTIYFSSGNKVLSKLTKLKTPSQQRLELHAGMLTLSNDGSEPVINEADILTFSGISATDGVHLINQTRKTPGPNINNENNTKDTKTDAPINKDDKSGHDLNAPKKKREEEEDCDVNLRRV